MKNFTLLLLILLCSAFNFCFAQEVKTKNIKFILDGYVQDGIDSSNIIGAKIMVKGTDSSFVELRSDSNGYFKTLLKAKTDYTIKIKANNYVIIKTTESTKGIRRSTRFMHEFQLYPLCTPIRKLPTPYYNKNDFKHPYSKEDKEFDAFSVYKDLLNDNPEIKLYVIAYQEKDELANTAQKRMSYFKKELVKRGISANRVILETDEKVINTESKRTILFKIVLED